MHQSGPQRIGKSKAPQGQVQVKINNSKPQGQGHGPPAPNDDPNQIQPDQPNQISDNDQLLQLLAEFHKLAEASYLITRHDQTEVLSCRQFRDSKVAYENCVLNSHGDYHSALLEEMHQCPLNDIKKVIELLRVLITLAKNINGTPLRKLVLNMLEGQALSGVFKSVRHTLHHMPHAAMRIYGGQNGDNYEEVDWLYPNPRNDENKVVYGLKILKWNLEGHQKQSRTVQSGSSPVHDLLVKALEVGPYILYLPFRQLDEANLFDTVFVSRAILAVKAKLLLAQPPTLVELNWVAECHIRDANNASSRKFEELRAEAFKVETEEIQQNLTLNFKKPEFVKVVKKTQRQIVTDLELQWKRAKKIVEYFRHGKTHASFPTNMFNRMLGKYSFEKLIPSKEDQREAYTKEVALFTGKAFDLKSEVSEEISAQNSFIDSDSVPTNNAQVKKDMDQPIQIEEESDSYHTSDTDSEYVALIRKDTNTVTCGKLVFKLDDRSKTIVKARKQAKKQRKADRKELQKKWSDVDS